MELSASATRALLSGFDDAYGELLRQLSRRTGCKDDAHDLLHDVWLRLAEHAKTVNGAEDASDEANDALRNPQAYLSTMTRNLALDHLRRSSQRAVHLHEETVQSMAAPHYTPDVADSVMYQQAVQAVSDGIAALPARSREVFLAHRLHGERQANIAQRMGLSLNSVERDLMQASGVIEDALHRWRGDAPAAAPLHRAGRRRSLSALLGLSGLGVVGSIAWMHFTWESADHILWQVSLSNPRGRRSIQPLPDGSQIELDAWAQAEVRYYAGRRTVQLLQGAAFFAVASDASRPFIVAAQGVDIRVLGTRFGVDIEPGDAVLVQVETGLVRVSRGPDEAVEIGAGQAIRIAQNMPWPKPQPDAHPSPWRYGELVFNATPLAQALERLARHAPFALSADLAVASLPVSGHLRIASANTWLAALPRSLPVRVQRSPDGAVHVVAR